MIRIVLVPFAALSLLFADSIPGTTARAHDVTASVAGGTLKLKGDTDPNILTLDLTQSLPESPPDGGVELSWAHAPVSAIASRMPKIQRV